MGRTMSRPRTPQPAGGRPWGGPLWIEWTLATRFLREGQAQSTLILVGIAVGVAVLVFLTALITGLQNNIIDRTLGTQAHIKVQPPKERNLIAPRTARPCAAGAGGPTRPAPALHQQLATGARCA